MAGLDPAIHAFAASGKKKETRGCPGSSPGMTSFAKNAIPLAAF